MKLTEKEREKFLKDKKFYSHRESYCFGRTLEEAGEILRCIIEDREEEDESEERKEMDNGTEYRNVGMVS